MKKNNKDIKKTIGQIPVKELREFVEEQMGKNRKFQAAFLKHFEDDFLANESGDAYVEQVQDAFLDATLEGDVTRLDINLSGSSNIVRKVVENQYALVCYEECKGKMSGSSDAYITCWGSIEVDLSGASNLHYTGNAETTGSTTSGGSKIIHDENP